MQFTVQIAVSSGSFTLVLFKMAGKMIPVIHDPYFAYPRFLTQLEVPDSITSSNALYYILLLTPTKQSYSLSDFNMPMAHPFIIMWLSLDQYHFVGYIHNSKPSTLSPPPFLITDTGPHSGEVTGDH